MRPGDVVADRFEIRRYAGQGGIGTVYQCHDLLRNSPVAVKIMRPHPEAERSRFVREAHLLSQLTHPSIVRYLAHGSTPDGGMFLAMDWLDGEDLCTRLSRERLSIEQSVTLVRRAIQALSVAHKRAIIHRDVKPSNLFLLDRDPEQVVVLDFGIARQMVSTHAVTNTGIVLGTIGYMAPEQARGDQDIDVRVDIFALGCVLFECLTGRPAFPGTNFAAVLAKVLYEEVPKVRDLKPEASKQLSELVSCMLEKNRDKRPSDAMCLLRELDELQEIESQGPPSATHSSDVLTIKEQRLLSIVLVSMSEEKKNLEDIGFGNTNPHAALVTLRTITKPVEGEFTPLANNCAMVMLKGYGNAVDQAIHAASYSLALHTASPDLRIALATGRAEIAGHWPVGQVIDRAAELLDEAAKDSRDAIYVDEATASLIDSRYEITGEGSVRLLIGESFSLQSTRCLLGKPTPCVGRQTELAFLDSILEECIEEPEARAVLITSPPGIGKSRLRHEFIERIRNKNDRIHILTARGDPVYSGSAFVLASQLIRCATQLGESEPEKKQFETLKIYLKNLFNDKTLRRVAEFLGELLRVPTTEEPSPQLIAARNDPSAMHEQLRLAFEDWLGALCKRKGAILLVLEDLHWGDLPTVAFIESSLKRHMEAPLMVLALARPEVMDVFPKLWQNFGIQEIQLKSLKRRAAERLTRRVLGEEVARETIEKIVEQAEGNAFFLEELIRHVAKGGDTRLPETVVAMVQTRLEGLDREARRILRAASIFGEVFWEGGIRTLLGDTMSMANIHRWLDILVEQELLNPSQSQKFTNERTFEFRHSLFREAAHAMLTEDDRLLGHRLAAGWLEQAGEKDTLVLADHFEQGGEKQRAIKYFVRAAQAAFDGGNYDAVFPICDRGILCGAQEEELGELLLLKAERSAVSDELDKVPEFANKALYLLPKGGASWISAVAVLGLAGSFEGNLVSLMRALDAYQSYRGGLPATGPAGLASWVLYGCFIYGGQAETAHRLLARLENQEELTTRSDLVFSAYQGLMRAFSSLFGLGELGKAFPNAKRAVRLFSEAKNKIGLSMGLYQLGWAQMAIGRLEEGERTCQQSVDYAKEINFFWAERKATLVLGTAQIISGKVDMGIDTLHPLLESTESLNSLMAQTYIALGHCLKGDIHRAKSDIHLLLNRLSLFPTIYTQALVVLGRIELLLKNYSQAVENSRIVLEQRRSGGMDCILDPVVRLTLAEALFAQDLQEDAIDAIRMAQDFVITQASSLLEASHRDSYLQNGFDTKRILLLAEKWLG